MPAGPAARDDRTWSLPWFRIGVLWSVVTAASFGLGFPPWALAGFPLAVVLAQALRPWRVARRVGWTALAAAFAAQATAVFVSPFTWPMRFAFFLVLAGAAVVHWGLGMDEF